jgi:hypothetical protein
MQTDDTTNAPQKERNIFLRILCGVLFFIPFYFVTNAMVGGVVGGIAGADTKSYAEGEAVGGPAAANFFNKHGLMVLGGQLLVYAVLCFLGWVPGVGKYRKTRQ